MTSAPPGDTDLQINNHSDTQHLSNKQRSE